MTGLNTCDFDHSTNGQTRRVPRAGGGADIVCQKCYLTFGATGHESEWPAWAELEIAGPEVTPEELEHDLGKDLDLDEQGREIVKQFIADLAENSPEQALVKGIKRLSQMEGGG